MHACVSCLLTYNSDRISQRQINRANQPATTRTDFYRRTIYLPLLDAVITDMQSRFSDETITNFNDLAYFIPAVIAQLTKVPVHLIDPLLRRYSAIIELNLFTRLHWRGACLVAPEMVESVIWPTWRCYTSDSCRGFSSLRPASIPFNSHIFDYTLCQSAQQVQREAFGLSGDKTWIRSRMGE